MKIIAIGGNLPQNSDENLFTSLNNIVKNFSLYGLEPLQFSHWYQSKAWPNENDPLFLNAVFSIETKKPVEDIIHILHQIEHDFKRIRKVKNEPRTLDLDILLWDQKITVNQDTEQGLVLPHPRMFDRVFVLKPLLDIAPPDYVLPKINKTIAECVLALGDSINDAWLYESSKQ